MATISPPRFTRAGSISTLIPQSSYSQPNTMFSYHQKASVTHGEAHRRIDHEIKELIHQLSNKMSDLHFLSKSHPPSHLHHHGSHDEKRDDCADLKVISLTGNNNGASMKADRDQVADTRVSFPVDGESVAAYANSNFQAVNNSVVFGGNCTANDPGIHLDIPIEMLKPEWQHEEHKKMKKKEKKKKQKKSDASSEDGGKNKKKHKKSSSSESSSSTSSSSSSSSSSEDEGKH